MPALTFEKYQRLRDEHLFNTAMASVIFMPVLALIISDWKNSEIYEEDHEQFRWFRAIQNRAKTKNIDIKTSELEVFEIIQKLFDFPYDRTLDNLRQNNSIEEDE